MKLIWHLTRFLCLQSILEGKGVFLKKIGKFIQPKDGFNVIATANTKGKGNQMTVVLLELTFSMRHSLNDSPSRSSKNIPLLQLN